MHSDKTIVALAKHVHNQLIAAQDEDDEDAVQASMTALPIQVLDRAIKSVADRVNYGLEVSIPGAKVVSGWHIWRWEVKVEHRSWLPKVAKEKVEMRYAERIQVRRVHQLYNHHKLICLRLERMYKIFSTLCLNKSASQYSMSRK